VSVVLKETHPVEHRNSGGLAVMFRDARSVLANRHYIGYTVAFGFSFAVMFSYISASPFVLQNVLGLSELGYSFAFAANAVGLVTMNALNAKIVGRFGQRRLLHLGVSLQTVFAVLLLIDAVLGPVRWATLILLWCAVASLGLVVANATSLALDEVRYAAGTGSAVLGALQFGLAAAVSPLVGIGGDHTAVPMAVAMVVSALIGAAALQLSGHTHGGQMWPFHYVVRAVQPSLAGVVHGGRHPVVRHAGSELITLRRKPCQSGKDQCMDAGGQRGLDRGSELGRVVERDRPALLGCFGQHIGADAAEEPEDGGHRDGGAVGAHVFAGGNRR
jgi:MFS family permease